MSNQGPRREARWRADQGEPQAPKWSIFRAEAHTAIPAHGAVQAKHSFHLPERSLPERERMHTSPLVSPIF